MKTQITYLTMVLLVSYASLRAQTPGTALKFDGTDSYVSISNPITSAEFTIEFWVKTTQTGGTGTQWYSGNGLVDGEVGGVTNDFGTSLLGNKFAFGVGGSSDHTAISTTDINDGMWHHVAGRKTSDGYIQVFVDGRNENTVVGGSSIPTAPALLRIGSIRTGVRYFNGMIDEVRIWNVDRGISSVFENVNTSLSGSHTGLAGYWKFNDGSGTSAIDSISGNNGTLNGFNFDAGSNWVQSTMPAGNATAVRISGIQNGTRVLGSVTVDFSEMMDFTTSLVGTELYIAPNQFPVGSSTVLNDNYWIIRTLSSPGTFSANLIFTISSSLTNNGTATSSNYTLYRRNQNGDGTWTAVTTGSNITSTTITFSGITSFGQFTIGTNEALPVELVSFTVDAHEKNIEVKWKTATEVNSAGFEIQKSEIGSQASEKKWISAGFVDGYGTTNAPKEYSFIEKNVATGKYAYRLKQIDRDGKFNYSHELETVVLQTPHTFALLQNYPNPFNPTTNIEFTVPENGHAVVTVYNALGQEVAALFNGMAEAGSAQKVQFNASTLSSGTYFARIEYNGKQLLKKMLLVR